VRRAENNTWEYFFFLLLLHRRKIGDLYEEEPYHSKQHSRQTHLICMSSRIHSANCKRRVYCAVVIFKQIYFQLSQAAVLSAQQPVKIGIYLCASRSDVPPLFSLQRFSLIVSNDIVPEIIKFSALYLFFYVRNFYRSSETNCCTTASRKNPFIFEINNKISVFR